MLTRRIILWLFVINLGIAFGAGLYEARVEFPHWLVQTADGLFWDAQAVRSANSGLRFWAFISTGPLTLLTLISVVFAWRSEGELRRWWLIAVALVFAERVFTFSYFIPNMIALMEMPSDADSIARAAMWGKLNIVRHILNFAGWMTALKAFAIANR